MCKRVDILFPLGNELNDVKGELGEMIKGVGKRLQFGFAEFAMLIIVQNHFDLVTLDFILLLLLLSSLIIQSFFGSVEILVNIFSRQLTEASSQLPETRLPRIDGPEDGVIDVLFIANELLFGGNELL